MASPQQILNTVNHIKLEQYEDLFDPQYSISQDNNTEANRFRWTDGVTSEMMEQGFNHSHQPHPFDSIYEGNNSSQIPFHYSENPSSQQQQNNNIDNHKTTDQFNFSQHRNSLPLLHDNAMFTPATAVHTTMSSRAMQSVPTVSIAAPYNRRYTEGSIPISSVATTPTTTTSNSSNASSTTTKSTRKQRIASVSSSSKDDDDEESKRKQFLERNRQAALKCRQRKKQWLANLQHRVEYLSTDNEQLQSQATMLKEEVINLKTLLLAHRDCKVFNDNMASTGNTMFSYNLPVSQQQQQPDDSKHWISGNHSVTATTINGASNNSNKYHQQDGHNNAIKR